MRAEPSITDWEGRLLRGANLLIEASVFYLLLSAWSRPRDGAAALLPLLACLALLLAVVVRVLLDSTTVPRTVRWLAVALASAAWATVAARLCAPASFWESDSPRTWLLLGAITGGRETAGFQPLAFWASVLLWWRGHALPAWEPSIDDALSRFRLGCLVVGTLAAFSAAADLAGSLALVQLEQVVIVAVFLVASLLTTALSRRREMLGGQPTPLPLPALHGRPARPLTAILILVLAAAALGLAALGATGLTPAALEPAVAVGRQLLDTLGWGVLTLFGWLGHLVPPPAPVQSGEPPASPAGDSGNLSLPGLEGIPDFLGPLLFYGLIAAGGLIFGSMVVTTIRSFKLRDLPGGSDVTATPGQEDQSPTAISARGQSLATTLLARLWQLIFRRRGHAHPPPAPRTAPSPLESRRHTIRSAYRQLLCWAARQGYQRRQAETPDELQTRLAAALPGTEADVAELTELYVAVRYGGRPVSTTDQSRAEHALARLEALAPPSTAAPIE